MIGGRPPRYRAPFWRRSRGAPQPPRYGSPAGEAAALGSETGARSFCSVLVGSLSAPYRAAFSALTPSFSTRTSIRRFCWRPAAESLLTNGYLGP